MHPHEKPSLQRRIAVARMSGSVIRATHGKTQSGAGHGAAFRRLEVNGSYGLFSASFFEISAVSAGVPQLGASLPSPHLRGR